jgi:hypothetical protein
MRCDSICSPASASRPRQPDVVLAYRLRRRVIARRCLGGSGCGFWAGPGVLGAALEDAGEPAGAGAMIVFLLGPRFAAAGASVCPWGRPATRTPHDNPYIRPVC